MPTRNKLVELKDDFSDLTKNYVRNALKFLDLDTEAELLLKIRKLLWNEEEFNKEQYEAMFVPVLKFYKDKTIDVVDFKVFLNLGEQAGVIDNNVKLVLIFVLENSFPSNMEDALKLIHLQITEYGLEYPPFHQVYHFLEEMGLEGEKSLEELESKSKSLHQRPEYIQDIISHSNSNQLLQLAIWSDPETREVLVEYAISSESDNLHSESYQGLLSLVNAEETLSQFPLSFEVFQDVLPKLPPQTLDMNTVENVPKDFSRDWVPKFVYSDPDLPEKIRIYFPGGKHIGHSAIIIRTNYGSFLLDFGMSVVNNSIPSWFPLMEKLDFILISHAHMDHSGALPLLYGKSRQLPWFALPATKTMTEMLWYDTRSIIKKSYSERVISSNPFLKRLSSRGSIINALQNFHEIRTHRKYKMLPNVSIEAKPAAHLFGSVGFEIEIGQKKLLYTGDFNADNGAEFNKDMDLTIFDGTYFERYPSQPDPDEELKRLLDQSNRILIPAFSMGRSQEILFKLKNLKAEKNWKIYLTGMASRLATNLGLTVGASGGGQKRGVILARTVNEDEFTEKTIVIGGQGMLQAGTSRRLFEASSDDPDTSVVLCGYQAPNTLGFHLLQGHTYLKKRYKQKIVRIKMSGHTGGEGLDQFLDHQKGRKIMVHTPVGSFENRSREDIEVPKSKNRTSKPIIL